jgi:hypothetical protein
MFNDRFNALEQRISNFEQPRRTSTQVDVVQHKQPSLPSAPGHGMNVAKVTPAVIAALTTAAPAPRHLTTTTNGPPPINNATRPSPHTIGNKGTKSRGPTYQRY